MKKIIRCLMLLLALVLLVSGCGLGDHDEEASPLVGAWRYTNAVSKESRIYCFTANGHLLALNIFEGEIYRGLAAHYTYEGDTLTIIEKGKEDGVATVTFDGNDSMTMAIAKTEPTDKEQSLTFTRVEDVASAFVGNWWYEYVEDGKRYTVEYAFTSNFEAAIAVSEDGVLESYKVGAYVYTDNDLQLIFTDNEGTETVERYVVNLPYEGFMTLEPVLENAGNETTPVYALRRYGK